MSETKRARKNLTEHARAPQRIDMGLLELLAAEVRPAGFERIDQRDRITGAAEHDGGKRAREAAARDGDVGFLHLRRPTFSVRS